MASLEEKRQKLLALRTATRKQETNKQSRMDEIRSKRTGMGKGLDLDSTLDQTLLSSDTKQEVEKEGQLNLQTHIGILNLTSKQPDYKYDRGVGVTKKELDLFHLLSKEQEDLAYPPQLDHVNDNDQEAEKVVEEEGDKLSKVKYLPEELQEKILTSNSFVRFVRRKSVEMSSQLEETKALIQDMLENENPEVAQDLRERISLSYKFEGYGVQKPKEEEGKILAEDIPLISHDELWSVVDIQWCRMKAEWFLAVYRRVKSKNSSESEELGRVVIWELNPKKKDTKECVKIFTCTKTVNKAIFSPSNENLVYGALSSGQIVVWDLRQKSKPVIHSKPTLNGHNLPIYCLENISDGRRDLLLSVSNEGRLCVWNPETLGDAEVNEILTFKQEKVAAQKTEKESEDQPLSPIASLLCQGNGHKDTQIYLATLDKLVQGYHVNEFLNKQEVKTVKRLNGHQAPICSISLNQTENVSTNGLIVTGSFDFCICLWKPHTNTEPICTFEVHDDYITGLDWNPVHPAMFVSADCAGKINVWDLVEDKDYPVFVAQTNAVSSIKWHPDGVQLIVGCLDGKVELWSINKRFLKCNDDQKAEFEAYIDAI